MVSEPRLAVSHTAEMQSLRHLSEANSPGGGECTLFRNFASNTLAIALQLRQITRVLEGEGYKALSG